MNILFVCTGNFYRSRLAEVYFNHLATLNNLPIKAFSVGTEADQGHNEGPISKHTIEACQVHGLALPEPYRFPIQITEEHVKTADMIILINEREHLPYVKTHFAQCLNKVTCWDILDVEEELPQLAIAKLLKKTRSTFDEIRTKA